MSPDRSARVADQVGRLLARWLQAGELRDPRLGFVTLNHVKLSPDLRHAVVYVSVIGDRDGSLDALNHAVPYLRRRLARDGGMRFTPSLRFVFDDAFEGGQRIEDLLEGLRRERSEAGGEPEPER